MVRLTTIIYCLLIFFLNFQAQAKNPPPGIGVNIPANVLIMLDVSGSMSAKLYASVQLRYPADSATDSSGNVYVLEAYDTIKVFDSSGTYKKTIGGRGNSCNRWYYARQIEIYNNLIYVADYYGHSIKVVDLNGSCVKQKRLYSGSYCSWSHGNCYPSGIAVGSSYTYVSYLNHRGSITIHNTSNLSLVNTFTDTGRLYYNWNIDLNSSENALVISNYYGWGGKKPVVKYTVNGTSISYSTTVGTYGSSSSNGYVYYATGVAFDSSDNIYVADYYTSRIQKFNSSGTYQAKMGTRGYGAAFYYPYGIHVDSSDNIYVADYYNLAVRKFNTSLTELDTFGGGGGTRLDVAKKVIKKLVSDSNLTAGANFGFMTWGSWYKMRVNISSKGAKQIYNDIGKVKVCDAGCGTSLNGPMNAARNLFTSGKVSNWNLKCSNNYLIVISDGYWYGSSVNSIANSLNLSYNVKTFAVGFNSGGYKTNYINLAKYGGTTSPLYADNEKELFKKLTDALKTITGKVSYNTLNTPAVIQKDSGDYVYQSTFEYKENEQWPGHLKKYKLNSDGSIGTKLWDAADKLNSKKYTARNIWTAGLNISGTNNFTTTYRNELKPSLFPNSAPTDDEVDDLINFIRGVDTYDEDADGNTTEERHKLNDIYNSEILVVGSVDGSTDSDGSTNFQKKDAYYRSVNKYDAFKNGTSCGGICSERKEVVYAGSNGGMLHAFDASDGSNGGDELWAYIPPNLLGKLSGMISSTANQTNSIYGVDGSMVVKDIYYDDTPTNNKDDPSWKTILLGGLGAGGHGYYALDITDYNSPKHLFAILNDTFNDKILHWDGDEGLIEYGYGGGSMHADIDYRELGEAWSTPRIIRIKHDGKDKWVAVFGGGFNGAVNPNYGSAVFVMDIENEGKLLKKISIASTSNRVDTMVSSIPSDLTVITANGTDKANYSGAMVYAADLGGKITKINMTDINSSGNITSSPTYHSTTLFSAESGTNNERYIYHAAEATINDDDNLWLYFGTGDMQKLETKPNTSNRIYGIKDKDFPNFKTINSTGTISQCKTAPICPSSTDLGWYINLKKSQKLTASVTIDNNLIHYPVYQPTTSSNKCDKGNAIKCKADAKCGYKSTLGKKCVTLGKGVLSKIVVHKGKLYMGISGEAKTSGTGYTSKDSLITGASTAAAKKAGGKIQLEGWREIYEQFD